MTTFDTGAAPRQTTFTTPRLGHFFKRILDARAVRAERRETYAALSVLNDHELDDIGLTRADVQAMR